MASKNSKNPPRRFADASRSLGLLVRLGESLARRAALAYGLQKLHFGRFTGPAKWSVFTTPWPSAASCSPPRS